MIMARLFSLPTTNFISFIKTEGSVLILLLYFPDMISLDLTPKLCFKPVFTIQ